MANTERLAALAKVRLARNGIQDALGRSDLDSDVRSSLTDLVSDLDDLEDKLILADISANVDAIAQDSADLAKTVAEMKGAADSLAKEVQLVDAAAKAVGGLASVVTMAASHGLLP